MPPKRKHPDEPGENPTTVRTTRSSTRGANTIVNVPLPPKGPSAKTVISQKKTGKEHEAGNASATKKTRTTKLASKSASRGGKAKQMEEDVDGMADKGDFITDDDVSIQPKSSKQGTKQASALSPSVPLPSTNHTKTQPHSNAADEPYTQKRSVTLFKKYADNDDPTIIGLEGFEQLCTDAIIPLEGALPLILAWQFGTKDMGKIHADEWNKGTESLKVSSIQMLSLAVHDLEDVLFLNKPAPSKKQKDPYDRTAFRKHSDNRKQAFQNLYSFCFTLVKPEQSRNIDMETATALWSVLLVPKYPLMSEVIEFINGKAATYKAANKDLWAMMLEFCDTVDPNLSDYEGDAAWPTLLDDFVSWKKSSTGAADTM